MATARKTRNSGESAEAEGKSLGMAIVLKDVPPGYNWGWYAREDLRMHVQTVDRKHRNLYKIWLEERGKRIAEPAAPIPAAVLKRVKAETARMRASVEAEWVHFMIELGWLVLVVKGPYVTLQAYPKTPNRFDRTINLGDYVSHELAARLAPDDVGLNSEYAVIEIWPDKPISRRPFISIPEILWQD